MSLPTAVYKHGALIGHQDNEIPSHGTTKQVREACKQWAIRRGMEWDRVLNVLQWDSLNGCYCFSWAGMYVGVETDGYIHT